MPLKQECGIYPDNLFDLSTSDFPWEVAHLQSRHEKVVAREMLRGGFPFYLPQTKRTARKRSGKPFTSYLPLLPGYVFLRRVEGAHAALWRTNVVTAMLQVVDQERLAVELQQIRLLELAGASFTSVPEPPSVGDPVRITDGPFTGYVGVLEEERGVSRLIVRLTTLQRSLAVEFQRDMVTRAQERGRAA